MEIMRLMDILKSNYCIEIEAIEPLRESGGKTFIIISTGTKYLLKNVGNAFRDTMLQSVEVMRYLFRHEFPVPEIICTNTGFPVLESEGEMLVLYEYIDGAEPDIDVCAEEIGELVGRLHQLMQAYPGKLILRNKQFFIDRHIKYLNAKHYDKTERYTSIGNWLWKQVEEQEKGYCHGDLHRGNLLQTPDGRLYVLDFDTSCLAPRMFDIMVMCDTTDYFMLQPEDYSHTTDTFHRFLSGYTKYMDLSKQEIGSFYAWIGIRHFQLQATILELFGLECMDQNAMDMQLKWLEEWKVRINGAL